MSSKSPSVEALLATIRPVFRREVVERVDPALLARMRDWSAEWEKLGIEIGVTCPRSLFLLSRAMQDIYIHIEDAHGWDLLSPDEARRERAFLQQLAEINPRIARLAAMMAIFGQDGDLILLASDGSVREVSHENLGDEERHFSSFDAMLDALTTGVQERRSESD